MRGRLCWNFYFFCLVFFCFFSFRNPRVGNSTCSPHGNDWMNERKTVFNIGNSCSMRHPHFLPHLILVLLPSKKYEYFWWTYKSFFYPFSWEVGEDKQHFVLTEIVYISREAQLLVGDKKLESWKIQSDDSEEKSGFDMQKIFIDAHIYIYARWEWFKCTMRAIKILSQTWTNFKL